MATKKVAHRLIGQPITRFAKAPTIRSQPQLGFSFAMRTTNRSISSATRGRPIRWPGS